MCGKWIYEKEREKEIINAWYIFNSLDQEHLIYFLLLRFSADHKKLESSLKDSKIPHRRMTKSEW